MTLQRKFISFAAAVWLATTPAVSLASSHREAPEITKSPKVDNTDFYFFNSYEDGRGAYVTLIANYQPFQDPFGGPNYFALDSDAMYAIHVDNDGDAKADMTFQFRVRDRDLGATVVVGGQNIAVPLINIGPIPGPASNRAETYTVRLIRRAGPNSGFLSNAGNGSKRFGKPLDNIGNKSIANYDAYASQFIHTVEIPGCEGTGRVFVGQRKESFYVNVGEVFDLVNLNPLGDRNAQPNALENKSITTLALEIPRACLVSGSQTILGGWASAWLPKVRTLDRVAPRRQPATLSDIVDLDSSSTPNANISRTQSGPFVQVSRLGMPLVNELVIGLADKDDFNATLPQNDAVNFAKYVTNPTLPELLEILFGVNAPNNFPRTDLVATFITGIEGLNKNGSSGEMQRLNTSIPAVPAALQKNLGVLGGDNAGFPNGRRPGDDVTDIELRVAMGALCHAIPAAAGCTPADAPSGTLPYTDGTLQDASQFDSVFPYLRAPRPGSPNGPNGVPLTPSDF